MRLLGRYMYICIIIYPISDIYRDKIYTLAWKPPYLHHRVWEGSERKKGNVESVWWRSGGVGGSEEHCQIIAIDVWGKEKFIKLQCQQPVAPSFLIIIWPAGWLLPRPRLHGWTFFIFRANKASVEWSSILNRVYIRHRCTPKSHTINYRITRMFPLRGIYSLLAPLILLLVLFALSPVDARWTKRPRRTTVPWGSTTPKTNHHQHVHHWPPLLAPPKPPPQVLPEVVYKPQSSPPRLIDSFDQRSLDGQYEFR